MADEKRNDDQSLFDKLIAVLLGLPWTEALGDLWKIIRQDSVIAYQDQAWGDGEILTNYRCTPGTPVDRYRKINVIFPKSRPPQRTTLVEGNGQQSQSLTKSVYVVLPDGRWLVAWETYRPRLYDNYVLQWDW